MHPMNIGVAEFSADTSAKTVPQLFAAETPAPVTTDILFPAGAVGQFVPLTTGYVPWVNTGTAPNPIIAVTAYAVPGGTRAAVYHEACFNLDAIDWPTGTTMIPPGFNCSRSGPGGSSAAAVTRIRSKGP